MPKTKKEIAIEVLKDEMENHMRELTYIFENSCSSCLAECGGKPDKAHEFKEDDASKHIIIIATLKQAIEYIKSD